MRLELSRYVESDLEAIADFIAEDSPARAVLLVREIWQKILRIGEQPLLYQAREGVDKDARLAVVGRYVVLPRVIGETVRIERVVYGGRDLPHMIQ